MEMTSNLSTPCIGMSIICKTGNCAINTGLILFFISELFSKVAAEDMEFSQDQDSDFEIPDFGNSTSDYSEVEESKLQKC
jgi:hypothetical protein